MTKNETMVLFLRDGAAAIYSLHLDICSGKCTDDCEARMDAMLARALEIESEDEKNCEFREQQLAESRARVGKFFKERDRRTEFSFGASGFMAALEPVFIYRAVTACDDRGQLKCWSFVRANTGAITVDLSDRGGIFATLGDEITEQEFYLAAEDLYYLLRPLLTGQVE